jgi:hypothetical protein
MIAAVQNTRLGCSEIGHARLGHDHLTRQLAAPVRQCGLQRDCPDRARLAYDDVHYPAGDDDQPPYLALARELSEVGVRADDRLDLRGG